MGLPFTPRYNRLQALAAFAARGPQAINSWAASFEKTKRISHDVPFPCGVQHACSASGRSVCRSALPDRRRELGSTSLVLEGARPESRGGTSWCRRHHFVASRRRFACGRPIALRSQRRSRQGLFRIRRKSQYFSSARRPTTRARTTSARAASSRPRTTTRLSLASRPSRPRLMLPNKALELPGDRPIAAW